MVSDYDNIISSADHLRICAAPEGQLTGFNNVVDAISGAVMAFAN